MINFSKIKPNTTTLSKVEQYGAVVFFMFAYTVIMFKLITALGGGSWKEALPIGMDAEDGTPLYQFLFYVILAPVIEELVFRYIPIKYAVRANKKNITDVVIISSVVFGYMHGYSYKGVLFQGVGGLFFSYLYIKNGFSLWSSICAHATWNFAVVFGFPFIFGI